MKFDLGSNFVGSLVDAHDGAFSHLEDFADRLSHFFSCGLMLMLAGVTMANVYFLRPISCTLPTAPDDKFKEFAESVCWVKGTVGLRDSDAMPMNSDDWNSIRQRSDISFYQWVPFCLSVQAMLFFIPHAIWQSLALHTMGENLESILTLAKRANTTEDRDKRLKCVEAVAYQLFRLARQHQDNRFTVWARFQRRLTKFPAVGILLPGKRMGNWIFGSYLFVKVLYLFNSIGQLFIIRTFLGFSDDLFSFGERLIGTLTAKKEWSESEFFPRQTYCPVTVRHLGAKSNVFTAICALPVNMFNEKIYIFLWLWIAVVSVITAFSLLVWLSRAGWNRCHTNFVRDFLMLSIQSQLHDPGREHPIKCLGCSVDEESVLMHRFIDEFVRADGTFLLRMMRSNAGDVVAAEVLNEWWHTFIEFEEKERTWYSGKQQNDAVISNERGKLPQKDLLQETLVNGNAVNSQTYC